MFTADAWGSVGGWLRVKKPEELQFTTFGQKVELPESDGFIKPGELDTKLLNSVPGFEPIPWSKIGLK